MITPEEIYQQAEDTLTELLASDLPPEEKLERTYLLCVYVFNILTESEELHFTTLFARMSYIITKFGLTSSLSRTLHQFRIYTEKYRADESAEMPFSLTDLFLNGVFAIANVLSLHSGRPIPQEISSAFHPEIPVLIDSSDGQNRFERTLRYVATGVDQSGIELLGYVEQSGTSMRLNFNDPGRSDLFRDNIINAIDVLGLPLTLSLLDVEISTDGVMSPRMIIVEPDFLVDVTSVAECFQSQGADARLHVVRKFVPSTWSAPLLLGGIANFFLDELVHDPAASFNELLPSVFKLFPLEMSQMSNEDLRSLLKKAEEHFRRLKRVISGDMRAMHIEPRNAFIEPTFYSPIFGLQGRLDLYHTEEGGRSEIIELKSGSPYRKNTYNLSSTHYTQTLLYDLMVWAAGGFTEKPASFILYSSQEIDTLRPAPVVRSIQREAIRLRNEIFLYERMLSIKPGFLGALTPSAFPDATGFISRDIGRFAKAVHGARPIDKKYFAALLKLIGEEQFYAKVGDSNSDRSMGMAAIWLDSIKTKNERFAILHDLVVEVETLSESSDLIEFRKGSDTNPLANVRRGDIAVLYPDPRQSGKGAASAQVYKCSVVDIDSEKVVLRLRNKQVNLGEFRKRLNWIVEPDILDSGFRTMYESLFHFLEFSEAKRDLFLGLQPPRTSSETCSQDSFGLGASLDSLVRRMIEAKDYFLLWGPPGTGKTSVVLRQLARYYLEQTDEVILLMAYTNRAVDEMCAALDSLGKGIREKYLRIGSRISTGDEYRSTLLSVRLDDIHTRNELVNLLKGQRIIVSTVSSILGKSEIIKLLKPGVAIVDEASQILEPMLASILPAFNKSILIGDHKQLPAVVVQPSGQTDVDDPDLRSLGLYNTRTSYFERLYRRAVDQSWDWAYGALRYQGRMHEEIMRFPCENFYDGQLEVLPPELSRRDLSGALDLPLDAQDALSEILASRRMIHIPSFQQTGAPWLKTNTSEARIVAEILMRFKALEIPPTIGVITPFRAQIAQIRNVLVEYGLEPSDYTIDTVERYQGSARDIVIMSTAVNHPGQLSSVVSLSEEGVDRKLNVALTRAREQFIVIGVSEVLRSNELYRRLLDSCSTITFTDVCPEESISGAEQQR